MEEDPTVFQYDELYDEMQEKKKESKLSRKDLDRKPKYINKLLETAERRKRENERRIERQVQKEREEEGEQFKDKESFVTSAYRKKLEELKVLEEQEKREEYLESIGDVRKQGNLDGFYRHLYEQKVNYDEIKPKRKYRKRLSASESSQSDKEIKLEHLPSNIDADSDFSIDSSDDSEEPPAKTTETKEDKQAVVATNNEKQTTTDVEKETIEEIKPKKTKIDIWKKRTVGDVFEGALQRYFERKSLRESLKSQ